jgi:hypothetical protein
MVPNNRRTCNIDAAERIASMALAMGELLHTIYIFAFVVITIGQYVCR